MVRQAIETATSASISTPVCPVTFTVARTRKPGRECSGLMSISTLVIGSGWQSGISPWVRLAAMMPASRAAPSTSPLRALPATTKSSVSRRMMTLPSATATRSVAFLAETSTMRAWPRGSIWVSSLLSSSGGFGLRRTPPLAFLAGREAFLLPRAMASLRGGVASREQRTRGGGDVVLPHQAFADQEGRDAGAGEAGEVGRRIEPAFGNHDAIFGNARGEALADRKISLETAQIAVVDADQAGAES